MNTRRALQRAPKQHPRLRTRLPSYLQTLHHIRSARPSMGSSDLGSDVSNNLSAIVNTWKLPDISSLHNVIRTGINLIEAMQTYFSPRISCPPVQHQIGGAERDRTADPLLAKQVLSQLSYSPNRFDHPLQAIHPGPKTKMVGPGRLELPTSRLSGVRSNHLSYGPILGKAHNQHSIVETTNRAWFVSL